MKFTCLYAYQRHMYMYSLYACESHMWHAWCMWKNHLVNECLHTYGGNKRYIFMFIYETHMRCIYVCMCREVHMMYACCVLMKDACLWIHLYVYERYIWYTCMYINIHDVCVDIHIKNAHNECICSHEYRRHT